MAKQRNDLNELRAQARKQHRAATKKISYLRNQKEVELSGSQFDPRRSARAISSYNRNQLNSYISQLETFNSRSTRFYRGARGTVITGEAWRQFRAAAVKVSRRNKVAFEKIAEIPLPNGTTIRQRVSMTTPKHPTMGTNLSVNRPFEEVKKSPRSMIGNKGALIMAQEMQSRLGPKWFSSRIKSDRESFHKMLAVANDHELSDKVDKLSDEQFNILWNYTGFADALGHWYQNLKDAMLGKEEPYFQETTDQSLRDVDDLIKWAGTLNLGR